MVAPFSYGTPFFRAYNDIEMYVHKRIMETAKGTRVTTTILLR